LFAGCLTKIKNVERNAIWGRCCISCITYFSPCLFTLSIAQIMVEVITPSCLAISAAGNPISSAQRWAITARTPLTELRRLPRINPATFTPPRAHSSLIISPTVTPLLLKADDQWALPKGGLPSVAPPGGKGLALRNQGAFDSMERSGFQNCGMWIAECGLKRKTSNPQSEFRNGGADAFWAQCPSPRAMTQASRNCQSAAGRPPAELEVYLNEYKI
jgi:hypothetical protein